MTYQEVQRRFRKSELTLLAWRSQEQAQQIEWRMKRGMPQQPQMQLPTMEEIESGFKQQKESRLQTMFAAQLPQELVNEDGEPDIRKMNSMQALSYMRACGFNIPPFGGVGRRT